MRLSTVLLLVVVLGGALTALLLRDFLVGFSDEERADIEARWSEVMTWTDGTLPPSAPDTSPATTRVRDLLDEARVLAPAIDLAVPFEPGGAPYAVRRDELPLELQALGQNLVAWADDGRNDFNLSHDMSSTVGALALARLGLGMAAFDAEDPHVRAVLRLARILRERGTFVDLYVGVLMVEDVVHWMQAQRIHPGRTLAAMIPRVTEVFPALARHAVSERTHIEELIGGTGPVAPDRLSLFYARRMSERLEAAYRYRNDLPRLVASLEDASAESEVPAIILGFFDEDHPAYLRRMDRIIRDATAFVADAR